MKTALDKLIELLDLEELEVNVFRGRRSDESLLRVFGGQVAGQALVAAGRTVEGRVVHSLHAYFLRPGDPSRPIVYQVDRIRDGKSFATRRVVAVQHGEAIFHLSASFQKLEPGPEHQVPMPEAPDPESLPTFEEQMEALLKEIPLENLPDAMRRYLPHERLIDIRTVYPVPTYSAEKRPPRQLVWLRAKGRLPDTPFLHLCVAAYASDMMLMDSAAFPHGITWAGFDPHFQMASLDHAMWFHGPFLADEWLLYAQESASASGARGFATGRMFTREGKLVVSVAQEGLMRPVASQGSLVV